VGNDDDQVSEAEVGTSAELIEGRFAENLRRYRELKGMSQAALADAMVARGWPWRQQTVARLESGRRMVRFGEAAAVAETLRISLDRFTWAGAEANEVAMIDSAVGTLRIAWHETALAAARLRAARSSAGGVLERSRDSKYERARLAAEDIAAELEGSTLEAALDEGDRLYENPEP
jgi:transcriptional regulator with XRE-family HTH domain